MLKPTKSLLIRVRPEIEYQVRMAAAERGISKSQLVAQLIEQHYPEHTQQKTET